MGFTEEEQAIEQTALDYARKHKKPIAKLFTDKSEYQPEEQPVSVFMAGSPGAGKTEASLELLKQFGDEIKVLRIDPDELRKEFADYSGDNSYLFQKAVSVLVDKIHDLALKQKQSFLLDGTLSHFDRAVKNIDRSLGKGRLVQILYVYQEPMLAWEFVKAREIEEGRRILPEHFIDQYFSSRESVNQLKKHYGGKVQVDLLIKNIDNTDKVYKANIDLIDNHVVEKYNAAALERAINEQLG